MKTVCILAVILALAGCGNKGPLVLPQAPAPVETPVPPPTPELAPAAPAPQVPAQTTPAH